MPNNIIMADPKGENLIYDSYAGMFYPKNLDITVDSIPGAADRYARAQLLETAIVRGAAAGAVARTSSMFRDCPRLKQLEFPNGAVKQSYIAPGCSRLEKCILGSIGHPVGSLYVNAFNSQTGSLAENNPTLTVYVSDSATLPLENQPWGFTAATVIYRSSTTGEIREVTSE